MNYFRMLKVFCCLILSFLNFSQSAQAATSPSSFRELKIGTWYYTPCFQYPKPDGSRIYMMLALKKISPSEIQVRHYNNHEEVTPTNCQKTYDFIMNRTISNQQFDTFSRSQRNSLANWPHEYPVQGGWYGPVTIKFRAPTLPSKASTRTVTTSNELKSTTNSLNMYSKPHHLSLVQLTVSPHYFMENPEYVAIKKGSAYRKDHKPFLFVRFGSDPINPLFRAQLRAPGHAVRADSVLVQPCQTTDRTRIYRAQIKLDENTRNKDVGIYFRTADLVLCHKGQIVTVIPNKNIEKITIRSIQSGEDPSLSTAKVVLMKENSKTGIKNHGIFFPCVKSSASCIRDTQQFIVRIKQRIKKKHILRQINAVTKDSSNIKLNKILQTAHIRNKQHRIARALEKAKLLGKGSLKTKNILLGAKTFKVKTKLLTDPYWGEAVESRLHLFNMAGGKINASDPNSIKRGTAISQAYAALRPRLRIKEWIKTTQGQKDAIEYIVGKHGVKAFSEEMVIKTLVVNLQVKYLSANQRRQYEVSIRNGVLRYKNKAGTPLILTDGMRSGHGTANAAIFVISPDGKWYVREHEEGKFHHSSFLAGGPVFSAGELKTNTRGEIIYLSNESGHYRPGASHLLYAVKDLETKGKNLRELRLKFLSSRGATNYDTLVFLQRAPNLIKHESEEERASNKVWKSTERKPSSGGGRGGSGGGK